MKSQSIEADFAAQLTLEEQDELALILDHYLEQIELGHLPDVDEICRSSPSLENAIRHYIKSVHLLQDVAGNVHSTVGQTKRLHASPPREIGDYRLIREIGRGGMGIVYQAQQLSLDRTVALKILPFASVLDRRQIARFQNEAQAAAQLHHPHIVPVYAIGNDRGTYFYSMQYIDGQSLDQAIHGMQSGHDTWGLSPTPCVSRTVNKHSFDQLSCDREAITESISDRSLHINPSLEATKKSANTTAKSVQSKQHILRVAELGLQASQALHFAHEHGIVHRDIKPSNLLIDGDGKLWITDFGLAQCAGAADLTRSGDVIGTLRYMSPEQAAGKQHWVDNRTDIYSLAVTLYELLTLSPAVVGHDRVAMLRQIENDCPISMRRLNPLIPVDFENILLKAFAKHRDDRYATAGEFAEDLSLFLQGKTPRVKRPNWMDRTARFVSAHSRAFVMAAIALCLLLGASISIAAILNSKNHEIRTANEKAKRHLEVANEVVDRFGSGMIERLSGLPDSESLQQEIAQNSIDYLSAFTEYAQSDPSWQSDRIHALIKLAELQEIRGEEALAVANYQLAEKLLRATTLSTKHASRFATDRFVCQNNLACLLMRLGRIDEAESRFADAILKLQDALPSQRALLLLNLAHLHRERGQPSIAASKLAEAIQELQLLRDEHKDSPETTSEIQTLLIAAILQAGADETVPETMSIQLLNTALQLAAREYGREDTMANANTLATCQLELGACYSRHRQNEKAREYFAKACKILEKETELHPSHLKLASDYASALNNLGRANQSLNDAGHARAAYNESLRVLNSLASKSSDYTIHSHLAGVFHNQALLMESQGDLDVAKELLAKAVEIQKLAMQAAPDSLRCQQFLEQHQANLDRISSKISSTQTTENGQNQ